MTRATGRDSENQSDQVPNAKKVKKKYRKTRNLHPTPKMAAKEPENEIPKNDPGEEDDDRKKEVENLEPEKGEKPDLKGPSAELCSIPLNES